MSFKIQNVGERQVLLITSWSAKRGFISYLVTQHKFRGDAGLTDSFKITTHQDQIAQDHFFRTFSEAAAAQVLEAEDRIRTMKKTGLVLPFKI